MLSFSASGVVSGAVPCPPFDWCSSPDKQSYHFAKHLTTTFSCSATLSAESLSTDHHHTSASICPGISVVSPIERTLFATDYGG